MISIDRDSALSYACALYRSGWTPLVCISMDHGHGGFSHHFYAMREETKAEVFGRFQYFSIDSQVWSRDKVFDTVDEANENFMILQEIARLAHIRHQLVDMTESSISADTESRAMVS